MELTRGFWDGIGVEFEAIYFLEGFLSSGGSRWLENFSRNDGGIQDHGASAGVLLPHVSGYPLVRFYPKCGVAFWIKWPSLWFGSIKKEG